MRVAGGAQLEERSAAWLQQYERTRQLGLKPCEEAPQPQPTAEKDLRWQQQGLAGAARDMREKAEAGRAAGQKEEMNAAHAFAMSPLLSRRQVLQGTIILI